VRLTCIFPLVPCLAAALTAWQASAQPGFHIVPKEVSPRPQIETTEPTGPVAELIRRLANDWPEQRQAAAHSLLEMGLAIEPQVRWALQHEEEELSFPFLPGDMDPPVLDPKMIPPRNAKHELEVIASHLEEARHAQTSIVSLHYTNAPLTNVLADLGKQAGVEMTVASLALGSLDWIKTNRVTVNLDRATYWQAVQAVERSGGLEEFYENLNRLTLIQEGITLAPPTGPLGPVVSGPLQISLSWAEAARSPDHPAGDKTGLAQLTFYVRAEPKLWNSGHRAMIRLDECMDEAGQSLLPAGYRAYPSIEEGQYWHWQVPAEVMAPMPGRRVKTLKGQISVALMMDQRYLSVSNLMHAQGQSCEFDGLRVTIKEVSEKHDYNEIEVDVSAPAGSPYAATLGDLPDGLLDVSFYDATRQMMTVRRMAGAWPHLEASKADDFLAARGAGPPEAGRQFRAVRHEADREVASWSVLFSKRVRPETLLWLTPPETRWLAVPFEFHDLGSMPK
jgi:hypothetical protein